MEFRHRATIPRGPSLGLSASSADSREAKGKRGGREHTRFLVYDPAEPRERIALRALAVAVTTPTASSSRFKTSATSSSTDARRPASSAGASSEGASVPSASARRASPSSEGRPAFEL